MFAVLPGWATKKPSVLRGQIKPSQLLSVESVFETPQKVRKDYKRQSVQENRKKKYPWVPIYIHITVKIILTLP